MHRKIWLLEECGIVYVSRYDSSEKLFIDFLGVAGLGCFIKVVAGLGGHEIKNRVISHQFNYT